MAWSWFVMTEFLLGNCPFASADLPSGRPSSGNEVRDGI